MNDFSIRSAKKSDTPLILEFIRLLAEYENLLHEVTATVEDLEQNLFGANSNTEVIIGYLDNKPITFALFFHNFSTFLAKKGLYLEDLFVIPEHRGKGIGKKMLRHLAKLAIERDCGRFEWSVLNWNEPAINFYKSIGAEFKTEWISNRLTGKHLLKLAE